MLRLLALVPRTKKSDALMSFLPNQSTDATTKHGTKKGLRVDQPTEVARYVKPSDTVSKDYICNQIEYAKYSAILLKAITLLDDTYLAPLIANTRLADRTRIMQLENDLRNSNANNIQLRLQLHKLGTRPDTSLSAMTQTSTVPNNKRKWNADDKEEKVSSKRLHPTTIPGRCRELAYLFCRINLKDSLRMVQLHAMVSLCIAVVAIRSHCARD